jgi:hypothetical protein
MGVHDVPRARWAEVLAHSVAAMGTPAGDARSSAVGLCNLQSGPMRRGLTLGGGLE